MSQKVIRIVGLLILAVIVFRIVLQQSSAAPAAEVPNEPSQIEPASAVSQSQIEVTRVVYVTATPRPTSETSEAEEETAEQPQNEPLFVVNRVPEDVRGADIQPTFELVFNKMVNQLPRQRLISVEPDIAMTVHWSAANILLVRPAAPLESENLYKFTLSEDMAAVDGSLMNSPYSWSYMPLDLIESLLYQPLEDGRGSFRLNFNYPIDPATVEWEIYPETEGELTWNQDLTGLVFEGSSVFQSGRTYNMNLGSSIRQPNGLAVPQVQEISYELDELVISQVPELGGYNISPFTNIEIRFRRNVDKAAVEAGLIIEPEPVIGPTFEWEGNTLIADVVLRPGESHTVRIESSSLIDPEGRSLSHKAIIWNFKTGNEANFANFGSGPRLQALQYGSGEHDLFVEYAFPGRSEPVPVTFELYGLTLADWQNTPLLSDQDISGQLPLAVWEEPAPPANPERYYQSHQSQLPAGILPGIYHLQMKAFGIVQDNLAVVVTDLGLAVRKDGERLLNWVVDLNTLSPVSAEVTVYKGGQPLASGITDNNGLVPLTASWSQEDERPTIVVARSGDQFSLTIINYAWQSYSVPSVEQPDYLLHLTMDRPLYQPGQTAYVRAVLRQSINGSPVALPPGETIKVTMNGYDYNYNEVSSDPVYLVTGDYGVAYGEIVIPETFTTQSYYLTAEYREVTTSRSFEVALPQNESAPTVKVTTAKIIGQGEQLAVRVEVTDGNGLPIGDKTVNITFLQPVYENGGCYWSSGINEWFSTDDDQVGKTDQNGVYSFTMTAEMGYNSHTPYSDSNMAHSIAAIIANVNQEGQTGTGFSVYEIASAGEEIVWEPSSLIQAAGQPFVVQGTVRDLAGQPVVDRAVTLRLHTGGQSGTSPDSEPETFIYQAQGRSNAEGRVVFDLKVDRPGYYGLQLSSLDRQGQLMKSVRPLYVTGDGEALAIPALYLGLGSRDNYVGQSAQLVILANQQGPALLSIGNREGIRNEIINLTGPITVIDLSLTAADSPAINIQVDFWQKETAAFNPDDYFGSTFSHRDGDFQTRSLSIPVIDLDKQLQVSVLETAEVDENGRTAVTVQVLNGRGEPVSAEVALSINSQLLFSHFPDHSRSQYSSLFRSTSIQQNVYNSLAPSRDLSGDYFGGCGCGGGWWGEYRLPALQNDLPTFWYTGLQTDHNGQATVLVTLPENPDGWHFSAQAITADGQVGEGQQISQ